MAFALARASCSGFCILELAAVTGASSGGPRLPPRLLARLSGGCSITHSRREDLPGAIFCCTGGKSLHSGIFLNESRSRVLPCELLCAPCPTVSLPVRARHRSERHQLGFDTATLCLLSAQQRAAACAGTIVPSCSRPPGMSHPSRCWSRDLRPARCAETALRRLAPPGETIPGLCHELV